VKITYIVRIYIYIYIYSYYAPSTWVQFLLKNLSKNACDGMALIVRTYIYIYREREREICLPPYVYIYIYIYIILLGPEFP